MNTKKTKIKNGSRVTREDGAVFSVRRVYVSGKRAWITENSTFQTTSDKTLGAAICNITHAQSKVTGWTSEGARLRYVQPLG